MISFRLPTLLLVFAFASNSHLDAQTTYTWNNTSGLAWKTTTNWTSGASNTFPGRDANPATTTNGTTTDLALFSTVMPTVAVGINLNTSNQFFEVGAISLTGTTNLTINNSSTSLSGVLQLNGSYAGSGLAPETLLSVTGANMTIANGTLALGLRLGRVDGEFSIGSGRTLTVSSIISEAFASSRLEVDGGGILVLGAANAFTGGVRVNGGSTLSISADSRLGTVPVNPTANAIILDNGTLRLTANFSTSANRGLMVEAAGGRLEAVGFTSNFNGVISDGTSGGGRLTVFGSSTSGESIGLMGANSFTGGLTVADTIVRFATASNLGAAPVSLFASAIVLNTAELSFTGSAGGSPQTLTANRGIQIGPASGTATVTSTITATQADGTLIIQGVIANTPTGIGALNKSGPGTVVLTGANTYGGRTSVSNGTLQLDFGTSVVTSNIVPSTSPLTLGNALYPGGRLLATGAGVANAQTFAGTTLNFGLNTVSATSGSGGSMTINLGAITRNSGANVRFDLPSAGGIFTTTGSTNSLLAISGIAFATVGLDEWAAKNSSNQIVPGSSNPGGSTFYTPSTATALSGNANITSGVNTTLAAGASVPSLRFNQPETRSISIATGQTLAVGGLLVTSNVGAHTSTISGGMLAPSSSSFFIFQNNVLGDLVVSGSIIASFSKTGPGKLILAYSGNSFTASPNILAGTLEAGAVNSLSLNASYTVGAGATLRLNGFDNIISGLSASAGSPSPIVENGGTSSAILSVASGGYNGTIQNGAGGTLALRKIGTGTFSLDSPGSYTYSGGTVIEAGRFNSYNTSPGSGPVTVGTNTLVAGANPTLSGYGPVTGPVTVTGYGTLDSFNVFQVNNSLTFQPLGVLAMRVRASGSNSILGVGGASSILNFQTGSGTTSVLSLTPETGFDRTLASTYNLINLTNGNNLQVNGAGVADGGELGRYIEGSGATGFVKIDTTNISTLAAGNQFRLVRVGNAVQLQYTPVAEVSVKWGGQVDGVWDAGTSSGVGGTFNWRVVGSNTSTNFVNGNNVLFDDSADGNSEEVTLISNVSPLTVTVSNSVLDYAIGGPGTIGGSTGIIKSGTAKLTLATANTYSGTTTISAGTLVYGHDPVTSGTTTNGGHANGTITSSPIGTGSLTIGPGATLSVDDSRVIPNAMALLGTVANPSIIDVPVGLSLTTTNATFNGGASTVLTKTGDGLFRITNGGSTAATSIGTIIIDAGTVQLTDSASGLGNLGSDSIVVNATGKFVFGSAPNYASENPGLTDSLILSINTGGEAIFNLNESYGAIYLQGGAYTLTNTTAATTTNNLALTSIFQSGTITSQNTNLATFTGSSQIRKTTSGTVTITGVALNTTGGLNIEEGVLSVDILPTTTGTLTFGVASPTTAGTFQYRGATTSYSKATVITAGGGGIDVSNPVATLTWPGNLSGLGQLTKSGLGTLHLTGSLGNTGGAAVSGGVLRVNPVTASGPFSVSPGGILAVASGVGTATFTVPALILDASSTVRFELSTASVTSAPLISVSGTDTLLTSGATLEITNTQSMAGGTYTLFSYNGTKITSGFTLVLPSGVSGSLQYTNDNKINAVLNGPGSGSDVVKWGGQINGVWDIGASSGVGGTFNWRMAGNSHNFVNGDFATFDDTASGNFNVTISVTVLPASVTVTGPTDYSFGGNGGIGGGIGLDKSGSGKLTLATANTYGNGTSLTAGTLVYARNPVTSGTTTFGGYANGTIVSGPLGTGTLTIGGGATLTVNATRVIPNAITIAGTSGNPSIIDVPNGLALTTTNATFNGGALAVLKKTGPGLLRITNGSLTLDSSVGTIIIDGGTIQLTDSAIGLANLGSDSIVVNNTGKFVFASLPMFTNENPGLPDTTFITVNSGGEAVFNSGESFGGLNLFGGTFTLANTAANTTNPTLADASEFQSGTINNTSNVASFMGTGLIRKTTSGTVTINGVALNGTGGLNIEEGVLSSNGAFGSTGTLTLGTASTTGTLRLTGTASSNNFGAKPIDVAAGGGVIDVANANKNYVATGPITGSGPFTKAGAGTLTLSNSVSAPTTVNAGVLAGTATFTAGTPLVVNSGGKISPGSNAVGTMSLQGGLTVASGGTLGLMIAATSTPTPDISMTGASSAGTPPTANSYLTLSGTSLFSPGTNVAISGTGVNFTIGSTYSYVVAVGAGDQSGLNISTPAQFTTVGFTANNFSLKGTADGKLIVSYVAESVQMPPQVMRYAVIGDYGVDGTNQLTVANRMKAVTPAIEFITTVGDNIYFVGSSPAADFANWDRTQGKYYAQWIKLPTTALGSTQTSAHIAQGAATNNFYPLLGNHDIDEGITSYKDYFKNTPAGETTKGYYKFTRGQVEFFMLSSDQREVDGRAVGSTQYQWAQANIQASTAKYKVVQFHHPSYTYLNNGHTGEENVPFRSWDFKGWGVSAIFVGHNHNMQAMDLNGLPYFLSGSAGNSLYAITGPQAAAPSPVVGLWFNSSDHGFAMIDVTDTEMTVSFIKASDGSTLYTQTILAPVPEPGSLLLLAGGVLVIGRVAVRRYRRRGSANAPAEAVSAMAA